MSSQINQISSSQEPRRIAIVVRDGMDHDQFTQKLIELERHNESEIYLLGARLGSVCCRNGQRVEVDATLRRWSGARFAVVYVMHARKARSAATPLIEDVFTRAAACAGGMIVNIVPDGVSERPVSQRKLNKTWLPALSMVPAWQTSRSQAPLATLARWLAPSLVLAAMSAPVRAQDVTPIVIDPAATDVPYTIDSSRTIVRSNTGQCWRTGTWTLEAAAKTKVVGSDFPAGCYCDKGLLPKETCEPAPMVAPPLPPQPVIVPPPPPPAAPVPQKVSVPADALFDFDKARLTSAGRAQLGIYADQLKSLDLESVVAVGHTDRIGSEKYNEKLSERRAAAVKAFLIEQGVPAEKVFIEGKGERQPVTGDKCNKLGRENASNHKLVECLAPDRRVDIEAVGVHR